MFKRINQFIQAITAKLTPADHEFISKYLDPLEKGLFYAMDLPTQRHCINVAKTCLEILRKTPNNYSVKNMALLMKGALLHDIGKPARDLSTTFRIITVLSNALSPKIGEYLAKPGKNGIWGPVRHAFYVQRYHPQLGAAIAKDVQLHPHVTNLIALHHMPADQLNSSELQLLRIADDEN